jgi:hypothetical protein
LLQPSVRLDPAGDLTAARNAESGIALGVSVRRALGTSACARMSITPKRARLLAFGALGPTSYNLVASACEPPGRASVSIVSTFADAEAASSVQGVHGMHETQAF